MPEPSVKYSNGFDLIKVQGALLGLVGWQQPTAPGSPVLSDANLTSRSDRFFNDGSFHAVVTPDNIKASQEDASISDTNLNTFLYNMQKAAIQRGLTGVFNQPEFIEQTLVYDRLQETNETITGQGKFVGFELNIAKQPDITVQLNTVTLVFDQDVTFTLHLFKDGKRTAVWTQSVSAVAYEATVITLADCYLNYVANTKGAKFYFGYFQDDLNSAKAIREDVCFQPTKMFRAEPVELQVVGSFIATRTECYSASPYGFNLEVTSFKDQTQHIVQKSSLFSELVGLTMAYMAIEKMIYSIRFNGAKNELVDRLIAVGIQLDLNGTIPVENAPQISGLKQRIDRELKRVKEQFYPVKKSQVINLCQ